LDDPLNLDGPLLPLTVALPRMLGNIEAELANEKLEAGDGRRLHRRAELIRELLAPTLDLDRRTPGRPKGIANPRLHGRGFAF
jgi:hypothetical protein